METFLVTVKLPRGHAGPHDPANKVAGPCPISGGPCSDVTGEHHSTIVRALHADVAVERVRNDGWDHITRVEQIVEPEELPVHLLERGPMTPPTRFPQWLSLSTAHLIASAQEYEALIEAGEVKGVALGDELSAMLALTAAELREEILRRSVELFTLGQ